MFLKYKQIKESISTETMTFFINYKNDVLPKDFFLKNLNWLPWYEILLSYYYIQYLLLSSLVIFFSSR